MSVTEITGGLGTYKVPKPRGKTMYALGIMKPGGEGQPTTRWRIATNGTIIPGDAVQANMGGLVATVSQVPVITVPVSRMEETAQSGKLPQQGEQDLVYRNQIESFMAEPNDPAYPQGIYAEAPNIHKLINMSYGLTGLERSQQHIKAADILNKTWPLYKGGLLAFEDNEMSHIITEKHEFEEICNLFTRWVSSILVHTKIPITDWLPLGWGMFEMGEIPKLRKRPGWRSELVNRGAKLDMRFNSLPYEIKGMAFYNFFLELQAAQLEKMFPIEGYIREDYMALAWQFTYQDVGIGTNSRPDKFPFTAEAFMSDFWDRIGMDTNRSYSYRLQSKDMVEEYIEWQLVHAMACHFIKAEVMPMEFVRYSGDKKTIVYDLIDQWHSPYDTFGSEGVTYIPARTFMGKDFPLPMVALADETNGWIRNPPITGHVYTRAQVTHGEVTGTILDPMDNRQVFIEWDLSQNDARRHEVVYSDHTLIDWELRLHGWENETIGEQGKWTEYLMALLSGTPTHGKMGYRVNYPLGVVDDPGLVNVNFSSVDELGRTVSALTGLFVEKNISNGPGLAQVAPGAAQEASAGNVAAKAGLPQTPEAIQGTATTPRAAPEPSVPSATPSAEAGASS